MWQILLTLLLAGGAGACARGPETPTVHLTVPERGVESVRVVPSDASDTGVTVVSVSQPAHGYAQTGGADSVIYTPSTTFTGDDRFTYTLQDRAGRLVTGEIRVTVTPVNEPPEPRHDLFTITWQEALAGARLDVLWNDSDYDGDTLRVVRVTDGARGTLAIVDDGAAVSYRARERFRDVDTFEYTVTDGVNEVTTWVVVQVTERD